MQQLCKIICSAGKKICSIYNKYEKNVQKMCKKYAQHAKNFFNMQKNMQNICRLPNQCAEGQIGRICKKYAKYMQYMGKICSLCKPCHQYAIYASGTLLMVLGIDSDQYCILYCIILCSIFS